MTRRTVVVALLALALGFSLAGNVRAFSPWYQMQSPCDEPQAIAIGSGKIVVACPDDSHLHYRDFP